MARSDEFLPIWIWGLIICVFATALTALGLVLQKYSHTLNASSPKAGTKSVYYRQPWWIVGFAIFAVAQVINLVSMAMAPQVMLSCLGATALIFNAIFAWLILDEELHLFEGGLICGMVFSVIMVISTTPVVDADPAARDVFRECVSPLFEFFFLVLAACIMAMLAFLRFGVVESSMARQVPEIAPVAWTVCAAAASGYTVNLFKASSEFIMAWTETRPLTHWECYVVLVGAFAFGIAQVHCLNCALNRGSAMLVVPLYFSLALLAQLGISEAISVDVPQTPLHIAIFVSGIVLILVFIVLFVRTKIAYEEKPDAEIEEVFENVFQSWPTTPVAKAATEATSLLAGVPTPPENPPDLEYEEQHSLNLSLVSNRERTLSTYDCQSFEDSFEGRERTYTVSMIGLGIA